jgi:hypothetical protein
LTQEYQQRNINLLDRNGKVITDKERVMDRWKEYYQCKLNHPRHHSEECDSEENRYVKRNLE